MPPTFVVLTNLTPAAAHAARYAAALGAPWRAHLRLLHLYHDPVLDPELVSITTGPAYRSQAQTLATLDELALRLPAEAEAVLSVSPAPAAIADAVRRYQPLLLVAGLSSEADLLDQFLHNQLVPMLRATHLPVLLVPKTAPLVGLPRRVALAVDAEPFTPNAASRAVAPLLAAWPATYTVVHVAFANEPEAFPGQRALGNVRLSELLAADTPLELYQESHVTPAAGILQAVEDVQADLLVLVARPRNFLGRLFRRGVTAQVLRHCRVPVLLLPAEAPELPGWMPALC